MGEHALIARLRLRVAPPPDGIVISIGDDAAVIEPGRNQLAVLTTDSLIEDVHFRRAWSSPADIGHKALAVNLSDLAAMGARPRATLLSLALPPDLPLADFDGLLEGLLALADAAGAPLVGGNISRSPGPLMVDVTVMGDGHRRKILRRAGGRPGDELWVTGQLGGAAAGLGLLERGATLDEDGLDAVARWRRPEPRWRCGVAVARSGGAAACVDLSDGLADAARQLAEASGTGVELQAGDLPIHPAAVSLEDAGLQAALSGGEDYELLFAVRPRFRRRFLGAMRRQKGLPVARVGLLTAGREATLMRDGVPSGLAAGFAHFGKTPGNTAETPPA
jgi:thiamine-monophosphate kinase